LGGQPGHGYQGPTQLGIAVVLPCPLATRIDGQRLGPPWPGGPLYGALCGLVSSLGHATGPCPRGDCFVGATMGIPRQLRRQTRRSLVYCQRCPLPYYCWTLPCVEQQVCGAPGGGDWWHPVGEEGGEVPLPPGESPGVAYTVVQIVHKNASGVPDVISCVHQMTGTHQKAHF